MKINNWKLKISAGKSGYTMIEVVVAFAILMGAILGPVSLITQSIKGTSISKNRLIAANLAQEGIELIRTIRENNILCDILDGGTADPTRWNDMPVANPPPSNNDMNTTGNFRFRMDINNNVTMSCGASSLVTPLPTVVNVPPGPCTNDAEFLRYDSTTGKYTYTAGTPTIYKRCLMVCSGNPSNPPCNALADGAVPDTDELEVVSMVTWSDRGKNYEVRLQTRMYNWR